MPYKAVVHRVFSLSHVLCAAFCTLNHVNHVDCLAIDFMCDVEGFVDFVSMESFCVFYEGTGYAFL